LLLVTTLVGVFSAVPTFASSIDLGINGDAEVGPTFINFGNFPLGTVYSPTPGYGIMQVSQPPLGLFLAQGVTAGEFGKIQSLDATKTVPGATLTPNPLSDPAFISFDVGGSNLEVFLTELLPGSTAGPFSLTDSTNGAIASFNMDGFVYNTTDQSRVDITGTFAATFNGMTVADLLSEEASGTDIKTPFTGTFSLNMVPPAVVTPEPASLLLFGAGLLGVGLVSRGKKRS
jgi:hypothetical protein